MRERGAATDLAVKPPPSLVVPASECARHPAAALTCRRPAINRSALPTSAFSARIALPLISPVVPLVHERPENRWTLFDYLFGSASHSFNFDHRRRPDTLRTAIATAFFWPTSTTSFLPLVTPV